MITLERCAECPIGRMKRVGAGGFPVGIKEQEKRRVLIGTPDGATFRPATCSNFGQGKRCPQEIISKELANAKNGSR